MNFGKLKDRVGEGLAIVICQHRLSEEFFQGLTFDQWLRVCQQVPSGSELKNTALAKMSELEAGFDQWFRVCQQALSGSELGKTALAKMSGQVVF